MRSNILDHITWIISQEVAWLCLDVIKDRFYTLSTACDKGWLTFVWITRFKCIANFI